MRTAPVLLFAILLCAMAGLASAAELAVPVAAGSAANRQLLEQAANRAIDSLGKPDGYFGNPEVRIPLPGKLEKLRKALQPLGASKEVDALVLGMNRAAESALPESRALIIGAIGSLQLKNGELAQQLRESMSDRISSEMLPVVAKATAGVQLAKKYNDVAAKASALGVLDQRDADLDAYVTRRALDGLFTTMKKEEATLRAGR